MRAFIGYHDILMERKGELTKAEKEMIIVATSSFNKCKYCIIVHGAILRVLSKDSYIADQLAINYKHATGISEKQKAMLDFAVKVAVNSSDIEDSDLQSLEQYFSKDGIWEIGAISSFFAMSNRMASFINLKPNNEFYVLGRVPKQDYEKLIKKKN